jgi:hypothetical protein
VDPVLGEESAVGDFAMEFLKAAGYDSRDRFLCSRMNIPFCSHKTVISASHKNSACVRAHKDASHPYNPLPGEYYGQKEAFWDSM